MNHTVMINDKACVGCGLCAGDCPENNIRLKGKKAEVMDQACMKCGHCAAICPTSAVTITGFGETAEETAEPATLEPEKLLRAIKGRRSIRRFKNKEIPEEILRRIIEAGRFTPTAKNLQNVSYIVLRDHKDEVEQTAVRLFRKLLPLAGLFMRAAKGREIESNFFFKSAPAAIVIVSGGGFAEINGSLAAADMALMAEAHGLGVLYSGFFTVAANHSPRLRRQLGMRQGQKAVTTLVLGYPDVRYKRTALREPAEIRFL